MSSPPSPNGTPLRIAGGAGPYETAAIAAAVEMVLEEERRASSPVRGRFSNWVMAARNGDGDGFAPGRRPPRRVSRPAAGERPPPPPGSPAAGH